jgi:hypothetical protein
MYQFKSGRYNVSNGYLEKIGIENYKRDYPEKSIDELKLEIEHIVTMLMENLESNRYTERIREKANKDKKINLIRDEFADNIKIVNYNNKSLKARVDYYVGKDEYNLILDMKTVKKGKVFLNKYYLLRQKNVRKEIV